MSIHGVDYSFGRPDPKKLKALGFDFAARYLSGGVSKKDITSAEYVQLRSANLAVVLVWEAGGSAAIGGFKQGVGDAQAARAQLARLGLPPNRPVYFAVDYDAGAKPSTLTVAIDYIRGAASVLGVANTGVYGGYRVTEGCLDAGVCKFAWQTYAWSYGRWGRAQFRQTRNGQNVAGATVDLCEAVATDYGQWPAPALPVPVPPVVKPKPPAQTPAQIRAHLAHLLHVAHLHALHLLHLAHLKRKK